MSSTDINQHARDFFKMHLRAPFSLCAFYSQTQNATFWEESYVLYLTKRALWFSFLQNKFFGLKTLKQTGTKLCVWPAYLLKNETKSDIKHILGHSIVHWLLISDTKLQIIVLTLNSMSNWGICHTNLNWLDSQNEKSFTRTTEATLHPLDQNPWQDN